MHQKTNSSIAFVGAGPTTIYTLHALLHHAAGPLTLTIFEAQGSFGRGTPYRPGWNDPAMLSNIASVEIPALQETLVDWLDRQSDERLLTLGIKRPEIDERTFYPRLSLGEFFYDQLQALIERARKEGFVVNLRNFCQVIDAVSMDDGMVLTVQPRGGQRFEETFDHVVLATGHQWPPEPEVRPGYFLSPWPASALAKIPPCNIGIRGSSLSAIDAAVALSITHGVFLRDEAGTLVYCPAPNTGGFHITMMSRKGLLPEADFYGPIPYEPLSICTPEAIEELIEGCDDHLLDRAFALFKEELITADPDYALQIDLKSLDLEQFCESYFAPRLDIDPFVWAEENLAEAQRNYEARHTVGWRYAILRVHEVIERLIPYLEQSDYRRFSHYFKPVFIDDYATVPHESIERMLALHRTNRLSVISIGDDYKINSHSMDTGAILDVNGQRTHFPVFIEATGQRALQAKDFPFPSLRDQGIIRDVAKADSDALKRGIAINDEFQPISANIPEDRLFCLSLPFIMGRHPFVQGITSSHKMGLVVGEQLAKAISRRSNDISAALHAPQAAA